MSPPVLPFGSLGGLQGSSTAGMRHTARRLVSTKVVLPNQEEHTTQGWSTETLCCHLASIGSQLASIAAASGYQAQWSFKVSAGHGIKAGDVFRVTGTTACREWTEIIKVMGPLVKHGPIFELWGAVDTPLDVRS